MKLRECLLPCSSESAVFLFASENLKIKIYKKSASLLVDLSPKGKNMDME
jgi:hypothetical protein